MSATPPELIRQSNAVFVTGPTASGKSAQAVEVAKVIDGEIINADPYQSYAGMPILTAQPEPELTSQVPHHLYSVTPLAQDLTAADFATQVARTATEIHQRGKRPVIVSGSGLYIKALTHGLDTTLPAADPKMRAALEATPLSTLVDQLRELDPASAVTIDLQNPRRVIRTLEICLLTGKRASELRKGWDPESVSWVNGVFIDVDRVALAERIQARTEAMFAHGLIDEVRKLDNCIISTTAENTLGLSIVREVIADRMSIEYAIEQIVTLTRRYSKRQRTWFRKESALTPIPVDNDEDASPADLTQRIIASLG
ncbi:tRNA (adenosine(37)-N6)-dimethylallyltransferase MiaA [Sulfuriroseicoccus oceanibius]|uniref:tRNA dimethylallyltransferase n=1 Tax=Sulfuriroseicoccus oceanibius TaxID=2707525 RepID=A0A6B3LBH7_9BACT|nr:tRNA (adenosine(37)-N6)-dimethylallyltransferase MiaA [Sulfuriroseicoccus oceanibius]QQL44877.1 tRNA (adenosine(37)-N6)-dimethylallyltransferase MiaA [Sulfuriroseicoccus oceanibius]